MKLVVFTGNRAEYGLIRPVIAALTSEGSFSVSLVISGSHLLERFGETASEIDTFGLVDVFKIDIAKSATNGHIDVHSAFSQIVETGGQYLTDIQPDMVMIAGDRHESFAFSIAAYYATIPIAHIFGGDLSQGGHLDDSVRHAITKLAHLHFVTNADSYERVRKLGEETWRVYNVGSPVVDAILNREYTSPDEVCLRLNLDRHKPIILFTQHPVTTEQDEAYDQARESLEALKELQFQTVITYPCSDPGGDAIIRAIDEFQDIRHFRIHKSLGWKHYLGCMNIASCVVGNSSSGLLETPYFRVPCINVGSRQKGRLRSENVIDTPYDRTAIKQAILESLNDSEFIKTVRSCSLPYGEGQSAQNIIQVLKKIHINRKLLQKSMTY